MLDREKAEEMPLDQRTIDDLSDLLQGRNSEHREYPYGHPKYRPPADAPLPYIPGSESVLTVEFASEAEAKQFHGVYAQISRDAKDRTLQHLKEIGTIKHGVD